MRTSEAELRARLRFLQIARLEGWEVATNYAKGKDGNTEDPDLVEARKLAAKNKKEREADATPPKFKKGSKEQSPAAAKQWARGEGLQGAVAYQQAGYNYGGANAYPPTYYNFPPSQPYYGQQPLFAQPNFWPGPYSQQVATPTPPLPLPSLSQPIRPPPAAATMGRSLICFACQQPGHIRSNCPNKPEI